MRNEAPFLSRHLVIDGQAALLDVLLQVVRPPSGNAQQFRGAKGVPEDDVGARTCVMRQFVTQVHLALHETLVEAHSLQERPHFLQPSLLLGLEVRLRVDEILDFHLLELAAAEEELPRRDLIAKSLADLRDPKRNLHARHLGDIFEIHENALSRLWPQITDRRIVFVRANLRVEHQVEGPRRCQRPGLACGWRRYQLQLVFGRFGHVLDDPRLQLFRSRNALRLHQFFRRCFEFFLHRAGLQSGNVSYLRAVLQLDGRPHQLVGAKPLFAFKAVHHGVGKGVHMTRGLERPRVGDDGTVEAHDVVASVHHPGPPHLFQVVLELNA
mmetsp:Transcript_99013/g.302720  ORF Transcript_99013/g.302720 Transcript_99013/m.302720 type:complete len:326 (-) Transcript_99013:52-1029(-)